MELVKTIEGRKSIRKYKNTPVDRETIKELIRCANLAPSWKNTQVSRFYVVDGEKKKEFLDCLPEQNVTNVKDASTIIVTTVIMGLSGYMLDGSIGSHLKENFALFDNGLQVQNLCLRAYDLGLGTLVMGLYDENKIRKFFDIPENETIVTVVAVGYRDIDPVARPRLKVDELVKFK